MSDLMHRLDTFRKEGSLKFAAMSAADRPVRNFADAKRENSSDDYNLQRIEKVVVATLGASLNQSVEVYKMFARAPKEQ